MTLEQDRETLEAALAQVTDLPFETFAVTGWVVVAEFMDTGGERFLTRIDGDQTTTWQREGMLHNALYGDWERTEDP